MTCIHAIHCEPVTAVDDSENSVFGTASDGEKASIGMADESSESIFGAGQNTDDDDQSGFGRGDDEFAQRSDGFFGGDSLPAKTGTPASPEPVTQSAVPEPRQGGPVLVERLQERRLRARKVRRLVRHIEPWSVLKVGLLFNFAMWIVAMVAGVLLWNAAVSSGVITDIEQFAEELFALEEFAFDGEQIFRAVALGGLVLAVTATGFMVLIAILLNLISDLTGGIRVTVVEEETARPISTLPRRG